MFLDETGLLLQPTRRRTWAPRGQTPTQYAWHRHDRLTAIGALTVSPVSHRLALHYHLQRQNVCGEDLIWFLTLLHQHHRRKVILVWDGLRAHQTAEAYFQEHHPDWFEFEPLPSYAPDLNPQEQCWNHAKSHTLANFLPEDLDELETAAREAIGQQQTDPRLLQSFFKYAKLPL